MKLSILSFFAAFVLRLLRLTYNYQLNFPDEETKNKYQEFILFKQADISKNFLLAFFHQDELCLVPYYKNTGFSVLVSLSKDGELMTKTSTRLGYHPVRGSSSKGAVAGLLAAMKKVQQGYKFAFAVDGPRGPIFKVKEGICSVSLKTQRPILPVRCHVSSAFIFQKAWNKAKFPKPFSTITLNFGRFDLYDKNNLEQTLLNL
jgi:lysophospholipid acyltransferase (LPLAT)-like uncharacterized protein